MIWGWVTMRVIETLTWGPEIKDTSKVKGSRLWGSDDKDMRLSIVGEVGGLRFWGWGPEDLRSRIWGSVILWFWRWGPEGQTQGLRTMIWGLGSEGLVRNWVNSRTWGTEGPNSRVWDPEIECMNVRGPDMRALGSEIDHLTFWGPEVEYRRVKMCNRY